MSARKKLISRKMRKRELKSESKYQLYGRGHELRVKRSEAYFEELNPGVETKSKVVRKQKSFVFKQEISRLKREFFHFVRPTSEQLEVAKRKLGVIKSSERHVVRFDNVARALTELHYEDAFARENPSCPSANSSAEASIVNDFFDYLGKTWILNSESKKYGEDSPLNTAFDIYFDVAQDFTSSQNYTHGIKKYNSVIFFESRAFRRGGLIQGENWGYINPTGKNPILGIMVLHYDPKIVYTVAKAMLRIRLKDPVVIFDIYGNVFFP